MRRLILTVAIAGALAAPTAVPAFHHGFLPAPTCASENSDPNAGGSNPRARTALRDAGHTFPLPPANRPGEEHSANTPAEQNCANASS